MATANYRKLMNDDGNTVFQRIATASKHAIATGQACGSPDVKMTHTQIAAGVSRFIVYDHPDLVAEYPIAFYSSGVGFFSAQFLALFTAGVSKDRLKTDATLQSPETNRMAAAIIEIWSCWMEGRQSGLCGPTVPGFDLRKRFKSLGLEEVSDALDLPRGKFKAENDERERNRRIEFQFREINGLAPLDTPVPASSRLLIEGRGWAVSDGQAVNDRVAVPEAEECYA